MLTDTRTCEDMRADKRERPAACTYAFTDRCNKTANKLKQEQGIAAQRLHIVPGNEWNRANTLVDGA